MSQSRIKENSSQTMINHNFHANKKKNETIEVPRRVIFKFSFILKTHSNYIKYISIKLITLEKLMNFSK